MKADGVQLATAVIGGAVGAVLTQLATFFRDWLGKHEEGQFTGLTLALALEAYAWECTEPHFTFTNYVSSNQATAAPSGRLPTLPEFSEKTNWRSIGVKAASDVLGFRVKVNTAQGSLRDTWEFEGKVSAWSDADDIGIELGAAALTVARSLRSKFRLGPMSRGEHFDLEEFYTEQMAKLERQKAARETADDGL